MSTSSAQYTGQLSLSTWTCNTVRDYVKLGYDYEWTRSRSQSLQLGLLCSRCRHRPAASWRVRDVASRRRRTSFASSLQVTTCCSTSYSDSGSTWIPFLSPSPWISSSTSLSSPFPSPSPLPSPFSPASASSERASSAEKNEPVETKLVNNRYY